MPPVIQVENLSKLYRLGEVSTGTLSHDLNRWWHKVRGKEDPYLKIGQVNDRTKKKAENGKAGGEKAENGKAEKLKSDSGSASQASEISAFQNLSVSAFSSDYVYALKDINFSVNQGEVLGIIGRNGAGKSTLLKILSRVTAPTSGSIKVKGRIASLLEVGTGFHPELTGRENIYLNGAILGMRRHEITRKLDEIVDFSGCAAYLDTPVKRYSSGMTVRLAFAVAAFLDAEILVIDEVLAVGDAEFQKRCMGRMASVASEGRTLLFVSHNLSLVASICERAICIEQGKITNDGSASETVHHYLAKDTARDVSGGSSFFVDLKSPLLTPIASPESITVRMHESVDNHNSLLISDSFEVIFKFRVNKTIEIDIVPTLDFTHENGVYVFGVFGGDLTPGIEGYYELKAIVPANLFNTGMYYIGFGIFSFTGGLVTHANDRTAMSIYLEENVEYRLTKKYVGPIAGVVRPKIQAKITKL